MKDKDFDQLFRHKFGQLTGEPASEEGWARLSQRLDAYDRRYSRWVLPVLLPLCFLLASGNVFWWHQWREATTAHVAEAATTWLKRDTIIQTTVVYRYDTIYRTLMVAYGAKFPVVQQSAPFGKENKDASSGFLVRPSPKPGKSANQPDVVLSVEPPLSVRADISTPVVRDSANQQFEKEDSAMWGRTIVRRVPADISVQQVEAEKEPVFAKPDSTFEKLLEQGPPTKKVQKSGIYLARPRLGLSVGWGDLVLQNGQNGYVLGAGLRADVEVACNFRLGGEIGYQKANMNLNETRILEELGVEVPEPVGDFHLVSWETPTPVLIYGLHLRYEIPLRGRFTPWLGFGGQIKTHLPANIDFTFQNSTNDHELHIKEHISERSTHWQGGLLMLGTEYQLNLRTYLGMEGYLLRRLDDKPSLLGNQLGLKASVYYKL